MFLKSVGVARDVQMRVGVEPATMDALLDFYLPIFADLPVHACGERLRVRFLESDGRCMRYVHDKDAYEVVVSAICHRCADPLTAISEFHYHNAYYYGRVQVTALVIAKYPQSQPKMLLEMLKTEMMYLKKDLAHLIQSHYSPLEFFLLNWSWDEETGTPLSYMLKHEDLVESTYVG